MDALKNIRSKLNQKKSLNAVEMTEAMEAIVTGKVPDVWIETFLVGLREKGETPGEITAAAKVMRRHAVKLSKHFKGLLDTCGTGGDAKNTLNVSTLAAIVAASAGVTVAKHGNRSVSSACGSADLLESLGIRIDCKAAEVERSIEKSHFGFFFAPHFHPATRFAMPARKKIKGKTLFNLLGPLSNPAAADYQLIGVYDDRWVEPLARVLSALGLKRALVVHGSDGMDEITTRGKTKVAELVNSQIKCYTLSPEEFGIKKPGTDELICRTKEENKKAALQVLRGTSSQAAGDIVCLNAGAALYVAGKAASIVKGLELARQTIASGAAAKKLEELQKI